ncbi:NMCC_0638 family (lipo)protein [Pseudoxanthomonas gei]|uniref:NMCC_0638 family (lipo)protein n=1 Tax=Pseudoxanthomonas gei TaxID=1383030 RepID=UPI003CCCE190
MRISVLATAAFALSSGAFAAEPPQQETFTALFATTCMQHFYAPEKLRANMTSQSAPVLQGEQSQFFLGGSPGTAWSIRLPDGMYVVSWRDDGVCTVFAQHAPVAEVQSNFAALVASAPEPLIASPRATGGPNTDALKTSSYAWHRSEEETELLFTLTTSSEATAAVQAMASMAVANKPNNSFKAKPLRGSP